jgi:pilus assembly protein CpaC
MKIEPEVSQIDTNHSVEVVSGVSVPALIVRRASTTVELRDGQSFAIGGLLQNNTQNQVEQLPWIGSVPVLGELFTSKSYQKNETDLVIIVTPRLVRPVRPGEVLKTPADATTPPSDADFFLMSRNEVPRSPQPNVPVQTAAASAAPRPFTGHMLDLPQRGSYVAIVQ